MTDELVPGECDQLVAELRALIETSRGRVAQIVNSEVVQLYWRVGHRLRTEVVGEDRAAYGERLVGTVSKALSAEFGRGFGKRSLYRMMRFAEVFPDPQIVTALRSQLTWTHLRELIAIEDPLKRQFYTELCRIERWSTRIAHCERWSPLNSSSADSMLAIKARWSYICDGSIAMSASRTRIRRWGSFCAPTKMMSRSNYSS